MFFLLSLSFSHVWWGVLIEPGYWVLRPNRFYVVVGNVSRRTGEEKCSGFLRCYISGYLNRGMPRSTKAEKRQIWNNYAVQRVSAARIEANTNRKNSKKVKGIGQWIAWRKKNKRGIQYTHNRKPNQQKIRAWMGVYWYCWRKQNSKQSEAVLIRQKQNRKKSVF